MKANPADIRLAVERGLIPAQTKQPRVTLPVPPSANNLFATVRGRRVKSGAYRAWLTLAVPMLEHLAPPAAYPCRLRLVIGGKVNEARDWDNFVKPIQDAAKEAGVIEGDTLRKVSGGLVEYRPSEGEPHVTVWFDSADTGDTIGIS